MPPCNNDCEPLPELQAADPLQRLATVTIPWLGISAGGHERHMIPLGQSHPWMASCLASGLSVAPAAALTNPFGEFRGGESARPCGNAVGQFESE